MAKDPKNGKKRKRDGQDTAEYYKLKTKAVEDLATADESNAPPVSRAELERYGARKKGGVPNWLKVSFAKFWFPGAVCFFIVMGLGIYNPLDQIVIVGIVQGMVTDLLTNNVLRFMAETDGANDGWIMFAKKRYLTFFFNIAYAMLLCACVILIYTGIDAAANWIMGTAGGKYIVTEPVTYGLFYMLSDNVFVAIKNAIKKLILSAKNKNVQEG